MQFNLHDEILKLIEKNGPMGVNSLSKELGIPVSTLQKGLHRQNYFKLNDRRKWDLPHNITNTPGAPKSDTAKLLITTVRNSIQLLQSQISDLELMVDNVLAPLGTLERTISNYSPPVADVPNAQIPEVFVELYKKIEGVTEVFKSRKKEIPEEYYDLLMNADWLTLTLDLGRNYINENLNKDLLSVIVGDIEVLPDETVELLEKYQKGQE